MHLIVLNGDTSKEPLTVLVEDSGFLMAETVMFLGVCMLVTLQYVLMMSHERLSSWLIGWQSLPTLMKDV